MPRAPLKRRHLHRNAPVPRVAKKIPSSSPARSELEKKLAHKPVGQRPTDSDDSDRLVVKGNGRRSRNVPRQEIYASGAVAAGDKPGNYPTRAQRKKNMTQATTAVNEKRNAQIEEEPIPTSKQPLEFRPNSPLANGITTKSTSAKQHTAVISNVSSSAMKPPGSGLRSTQPTPTRENSILGALKPRRRAPSILQHLDHDSSSFDLEDEDKFLPDAESTPLNLSKPSNAASTPAPQSSHVTSSLKRKRGSSDPFKPDPTATIQRQTASPLIGTTYHAESTPEPALPTLLVSTLRHAGRKPRDRTREEEDVMALPDSSSSHSSSPTKPETSAIVNNPRKKAIKPVPIMTTKELQAHMMPVKRRRTRRERTRTPNDFDIPPDPESPEHSLSEQDDESSFLPSKKARKTRRKEPLSKSGNTGIKSGGSVLQASKAGKQGASTAATAKSKPSKSTKFLITNTTAAPILTPSTSTSKRRDRKTKSPSQLCTFEVSNTNAHSADQLNAGKGDENQRQYGGSLRQRRDMVDGPDKENQGFGEEQLDDSDIERSLEGESGGVKSKTMHESKGKWADIDAWDMDFEDVDVMTGSGSSSPMRR